MMPVATIPVTANQLGLANPKKGHGLALLTLGLFLGILLAIRIPPVIDEVKADRAIGPERIAHLVTLIAPVAFAAGVALWLLYRGALAALAFFVPAGAPANLGGWEMVVPQLLYH